MMRPASTAWPPSRRRSRGVRWLTLAGILLALTLTATQAVPAPAVAGIYHVYSCAQPNGKPAPTDGWSTSSLGGVGADSGDSDTCAQGGSLTAVVGAQAEQSAYTGPQWVFSTPPDTAIAGGTLTATLTSPQGQAWLGSPSSAYVAADVIVNCQFNEPCGAAGVFTGAFPILNPGGSNIYATAVCVGPYDGATTCPPGSGVDAEVSVSAANIELESDAAPSASAVGGSLLANQILDGTQNVLITASDPGPGVYEAIFQIDGHTVESPVIDTNDGRCENAGGTDDGTAAFLYVQPCPPQVNSVEVPFNPTSVSNGPHELKVLVSDAAGNTTTILDRQVIIDNNGEYTTLLARGACNGTSCDEHARLLASSRQPATFTRHFGHSAVTLTGRLLDHTGAPITGAQVKLFEQAHDAGAPMQEAGTVSTDATGAWEFKVPDGPSRLLRVAYFSHLKDSTPAAQLDYHERVYAAVAMHARRGVRLGEPVVFRGQLVGGWIPYAGEEVQIEIFYDGRWRTIEVLHTDAHGRFAYRYIFATGIGSFYRFRASVSYGIAYPFLGSSSPPVKVMVKG
jgi:hypothetical protein